ncbi:MAG: VanZ family protein [Candidatus Schekmanbacteria bacterium]|nr:VanZ family protein [Candidatus Schekmanbacteria bacterium]
MARRMDTSRLRWLWVGLWLTTIYAVSPVTPELVKLIDGAIGRRGFQLTVYGGLVGAVVGVGGYLGRRGVGFGSRRLYSHFALPLLPVLAASWHIAQPQQLWHIPEYAVLAMLFAWALSRHLTAGPLRSLAAMSLCVHAGCLDEIIQFYLPNRVFDPADILLDGVGALVGVGLAALLGARGAAEGV